MKKVLLLCLFLTTFLAPMVQADHDGELGDRVATFIYDYDAYFTNDNPYDCTLKEPPAGSDLNYFPTQQAVNAVLALDGGFVPQPGKPAGYHEGYIDLGFSAPDFNGEDDEILIYDCAPGSAHDDNDCDYGQASPTRIIMPASEYCSSTEINLRTVMGHELFHHVQFGSGASYSAWGKLLFEGTARMMEDMVFSDMDDSSNTYFLRDANNYLANPNQGFWQSGYLSALAWKHLSEQYGTISTEPQLGVDFITTLWDIVEDNNSSPDVPATIEATIQNFNHETSLEEWFQDFTIANIAREFDVSALSDGDKYRYIDEDPADVEFNNVTRDWTGLVQGEGDFVSALPRWGSSYFEADIPNGCLPGYVFGYRARDVDGLKFGALLISDTDKVERLVKGGGNDFAVSFIQRGTVTGLPFEKLVVAVTGADDQQAFNWRFDCGVANLEILRPTATYVATVGPNNLPRPLQIRLSVTGPETLSNASVLGLQLEDFRVFIGTNGDTNDQAEIIGGNYVLGEYWLTVQPPVKPDQDTYDLFVSFGTFQTDLQIDAVSYEEKVFDQILVIDRSGSMSNPVSNPKIDAVKNAAGLFTNLAIGDDQIGVVSFNAAASIEVPLGTATDNQLLDVINQINSLVEGGGTSIGDGLDVAVSEFALNGNALGEDWIVLLSDGQENEQLFWSQVESTIKTAGIRVSTIALGEDSDQVLMQEIAQETGGDYYFVEVGTVASNSAFAGGDDLANRLADVYIAANEKLRNHQRFFEFSEQLSDGNSTQHSINVNGDGIIDGRFIVQWTDGTNDADISLQRPDGSDVKEDDPGVVIRKTTTHLIFYVDEIIAGSWTLQVNATNGNLNYLAIFSGEDRQGSNLTVAVGQVPDPLVDSLSGAKFLRGLPQPIRAWLHDDLGAIKGRDVEVVAQVTHPIGFTDQIPLFDDGQHTDGAANDGVYGNDYLRTTAFSLNDLPDLAGTGSPGSYQVTVQATGTDNLGFEFNRIRKFSFQVFETDQLTSIPSSDSDLDNMPDRYEDLHECLDKTVADGMSDADEDGIDNGSSYLLGLDPCYPDTDRGGESDISEKARGGFHYDPNDDLLPRPIDAEVINWRYEHLPFEVNGEPQAEANLIRFQIHPSYNLIRLLRSLNEQGGPFTQVAEFSAAQSGGLYLDSGLNNGVTYYYKVQPLDINGNLGAPSHVFSGTPNADPIPPIGSVLINKGAEVTTQINVDLSLVASSDTATMMVSNDASFDGVVTQPFKNTIPWNLDPNPDTNLASVYVKFQDINGNESPSIYSAGVMVVDSDDVGTIRGRGVLEGETEHSNIFVQPTGFSNVQPGFTNSSSSYTLRHVEPGTYDIGLGYPGYQSVTIENVIVVGGQTTFLESVTLLVDVADTDGDGIADDTDNCINVANANQIDSNDDGYGNQCDADINDDCVVNFLDIVQIQAVFFTDNANADFNSDGVVNFIDFFNMTESFLQTPGPSANATCP